MTLEEAQKLWNEAPRPFKGTMIGDRFISGYLEGQQSDRALPVFSRGKGGRIWAEIVITKELLQALIVIGRSQVPDEEIGFRWYRTDHTSDKEQAFDDSPMTPTEAEMVLKEKPNGYFQPKRPTKDTQEMLAMGEAVLEELEAYLLLWEAK